MTLEEFLAARLSDDEAAAKAATPGPWEFEGDDPTDDELFTVHDGEHGDLIGEPVAFTRGGSRQVANGQHMALHDPARVLREVEAGRKFLAEVVPDIKSMDDRIISEWGTSQDVPDAHLPLLRIMAAVWSDHPDYDEAWRP